MDVFLIIIEYNNDFYKSPKKGILRIGAENTGYTV